MTLQSDADEFLDLRQRAIAALKAQGNPDARGHLSEADDLERRLHRLELELQSSDLRAVLNEKERLRHALEHAYQMELLGIVASGVAHEFNNLIMAIIGCADLALSRVEEAHTAREPIHGVKEAAERAAVVLHKLLEIARPTATASIVDLNRVVVDSEMLIRQLLGHNIALSLELRAEEGRIAAHAGQLQELLLSLIVNAKRALPNGGSLCVKTETLHLTELTAETEPGARLYLALSVRHAENMQPGPQQSGLDGAACVNQSENAALALARQIVRKQGGLMRCYEQSDGGTTVRVVLPLATASELEQLREQRAERAHVQVAPTDAKKTVLLVDDERLIRQVVRRYLEVDGFDVVEAQSAQEALEILKTAGPVHILISDVGLPDLAGTHLASKIAAEFPGIKVLLMSGYSEEFIRTQHALPEGSRLLQKPFTPEVLTESLSALLDRAAE